MDECSIKKHLEEVHKNMKKPAMATITHNCSLFRGRRICISCCLHISAIADPAKRVFASYHNPEYDKVIPEIVEAPWDSIWKVCSECRNSF